MRFFTRKNSVWIIWIKIFWGIWVLETCRHKNPFKPSFWPSDEIQLSDSFNNIFLGLESLSGHRDIKHLFFCRRTGTNRRRERILNSYVTKGDAYNLRRQFLNLSLYKIIRLFPPGSPHHPLPVHPPSSPPSPPHPPLPPNPFPPQHPPPPPPSPPPPPPPSSQRPSPPPHPPSPPPPSLPPSPFPTPSSFFIEWCQHLSKLIHVDNLNSFFFSPQIPV